MVMCVVLIESPTGYVSIQISLLCRRRFDFHSPSRMDRGLELFISIHKDLAESKRWKPPRVFINPTVGPTLMQQLSESVKRHQVCGVWSVVQQVYLDVLTFDLYSG